MVLGMWCWMSQLSMTTNLTCPSQQHQLLMAADGFYTSPAGNTKLSLLIAGYMTVCGVL